MRDPPDGADQRSERLQIRALREAAEALQKALPGRRRLMIGVEHGALSTIAALLAYGPAEMLGLPQSFWGAITAIAVVQLQYSATRSTGRDQFIGALIGGVAAMAVAIAAGQHIWGYAFSVFCAVALCWALNLGTAARLSGTTATIIMLVPHQGSPLVIMTSRLGEVGWGVAVAVLVVGAADRLGLTSTPKS